MLETATATTVTLDWAVAAAAGVIAPEACAVEMAWLSRAATTAELVRSTVAGEAWSRRRLPADKFEEDDAEVPLRILLAMAVRTACSAAAIVVAPEMRAMP